MLIDLLALEYNRLHPARTKPADQFSDEITAFCSLLERHFPELAAPMIDPEP
jgi:hypothetical protein